MLESWKNRIIDIYIVKEVLFPFLSGIAVVTIIMLSNFLFQLTDLIIVKNVPIFLVLRLLIYKLPEIIVQTFPIAILFATISGIGRLSRENEFTALRMGGISLYRLILPLVMLGILISSFTYFLNENIVPWSNHQANNIIRKTILQEAMPDVRESVFFRGPEGRLFYVGNYNEEAGKLSKVVIYNFPDKKDSDYPEIITADRGKIQANSWTLFDGIIHEYDKMGNLTLESQFGEMEVKLAAEDVNLMGEQKTTSEMSREELNREIKLFQKSGIDVTSLLVDYHLKLSKPLAALIFILIGTPLSLTQKDSRVGSILVTVGIIFLYYLTLSLSRSFARNGFIQPILAAWLPNIVFCLVGVMLLFWRESWQNFLRKILPGLTVFIFITVLVTVTPLTLSTGAEEIKLEGEHLQYDKNTGIVEITNNVSGKYQKYYFKADRITLKLKDGAEKILTTPEEIEMLPGGFTGCDYEEPHYIFKAKKITIFPGDYLEAYNVVFYEWNGKLPLFYWPYLYISLKEDEQKIVPQFGYDSRRGWFVKLTYNYWLTRKLPGDFYLDYYTISGKGYGFKQHFLYDEKQKAYFYYYTQDNKTDIPGLFNWQSEVSYTYDRDNWQSEVSYTYDRDNWNIDSYFNYSDYDEKVRWEGIMDVSSESENQHISLNSYFVNDDYYQSNNDEQKIDMTLNFDRSFDSGLDLSAEYNRDLNVRRKYGTVEETRRELDINYMPNDDWDVDLFYRYEVLQKYDDPRKDRWQGEGSVTRKFDEVELELLLERYDPQFDEEDMVRFYRWPEVNLYYNPRGSNFKYNLQAGNYYEDVSKIKGKRASAVVNYDNYLDLKPGMRLEVKERLTGRIYNTVELQEPHQLAWNNKLSLVNNLTDNLRLTNSYELNIFRGETPFNFDQEETLEEYTANLRYNINKIDLELEGGYNIYERLYLPLELIMGVRPVPGWSLQMGTAYDLNEKEFDRELILKNNLKKTNWNLQTVIRYDMNEKRMKLLNNKLVYEIPGDWGWYLENNISYDYDKPEDERLKRANIVLKKKFHCRELIFSYDYIQKQVMVTYQLDLFPQQSIRVGRNEEDSFIFDLGIKEMLAD